MSAIGIDLGTSSILLCEKKKGIVLREPSVVAFGRDGGKVIAIGALAQQMLGRTPETICALSPIRGGVISDYEMCRYMLSTHLKKYSTHSFSKPDVVFSVPSTISQLEERALIDTGMSAGARRVYMVESVLAAAIGAGVDFYQPEGRAIIDIGGGTCDIGILSLGGIVRSMSLRVGGDNFDAAIVRYLRKNRHILVGDRIAEEIKIHIGCVLPRPTNIKFAVQGRDLSGGFVGNTEISSTEVCNAFEDIAMQIVDGLQTIFESIPSELMTDISASGITLTGGGSLLWGMDEYIHRYTGIPVKICDDPISAVACGLGKIIPNLRHMQPGVINIARRHLLNIQ